MLSAVLYISIMNRDYTNAELEQLLHTFRANNNKYNISGLMLYYESHIIQYIEGPTENINRLYDNIKKDNRHSYIVTFLNNNITTRIFKDWTLGFQKINKEKFIEFTKLNLKECIYNCSLYDSSIIKKLFHTFINTHLPSAMI